MQLNNPAPRVTRVSAPRATASAGSHRAHGFWRSHKCGPARGNPALPVPGLWAWGEGGRVLPFAPTPSGRRTQRSLAEQVCVPARWAPGPGPGRSPAGRRRPVLGLPPPRPGSQRANSRHFCRVSAGQEGWERKTPASLPRRSFYLPPSARFPFGARTPRDRQRRRPGIPGRSAPSSLTRRFLTARPFFSLFFLFSPPLLLKPSPERGLEARRGWWASRAKRAPVLPPCSSRGREAAQATDPGRPGPATPGRAEPHTKRPRPMHPPGRCAPGSEPGPWPSAGPAARAQKSSAFRTGNESFSSASGQPEPPLLRGSPAPSPAGDRLGLELLEGLVEQRTDPASPLMVSPPWAASPGGPHGSSPPKFVVPWKKRLSLTKHKGETPRPSPEKPGAGEGGRPEARERGGGARLPGGEGRSAGADEHRGGGRRTAATCVLAEKFCSQVEGRENCYSV